MAELFEVQEQDFPRIYPLLKRLNSSKVDEKQWRNLFAPLWPHKADFLGYGLRDNGKIVGFVGVVHSRRCLAGARRKSINITSWIVDESYRSEGLRLVLPLREEKDAIITNLTPNREAYHIFTRLLPCEVLEDTVLIFLPFLHLRTLFSFLNTQITSQIRGLDPALAQIHQDHREGISRFFQLRRGGSSCLVMGYPVKRKGLPCFHVTYISDPGLFSLCLMKVQAYVLVTWGAILVSVDSRLLKGNAFGPAYRYKLPYPRLFVGRGLRSDQIDNLYSELALLKL